MAREAFSWTTEHLNFCFGSPFCQGEKMRSWIIQDSSPLLSKGVMAKLWGFQSDTMRREEMVGFLLLSLSAWTSTPRELLTPLGSKPRSLQASITLSLLGA